MRQKDRLKVKWKKWRTMYPTPFPLHALKGQKHLAQGNILGKEWVSERPVRAKALPLKSKRVKK